MVNLAEVDITIAGLHKHYQSGDFTPRELVQSVLKACQDNDNPVWTYLLSIEELDHYLSSLEERDPTSLTLYGVPFAIKDNIDLRGIPTTAACPDFKYIPDQSAFVVQQLIDAGAIPIGKTNMDQFATGLVGVRSPEPWGPCRNVFNDAVISGGSSSGSAVAVAKGWVSFSLGTDTAGSGRVPAALNNIVGLKPSRGLLSCRGVVPACKSLDCVSIFALTSDDANTVFNCASEFDREDAYARENSYANSARYYQQNSKTLTLGVPKAEQLAFFGDAEAKSLFDKACEKLIDLGHTLVPIDFEPFSRAARLLYEGPWVTERYLATKAILQQSPESVLPVIRQIIEPGANKTAVEAFEAQYQLQACAQLAEQTLAAVDGIVTPTIGTSYAIAQVEADPIQLNSNLGYYTNFMNLLDCAAVAVPAGFFKRGEGFGITFFQRRFSDKHLLSLASQWQANANLSLGATTQKYQPTTANTALPRNQIAIVVCGAHMEGLPLNWQLKERGGKLLEATESAPHYKLYALAGGPPKRPGMVRDMEHGKAIAVEVWSVPVDNLGSFVAEIPFPLGIGKVELADGRWESGFVCDTSAIGDAEDITHFGGWRAYLDAK